MSDGPNAAAEAVADHVETVIENAEERAEQADEINELLTEAAVRDRLNQRIDDRLRELDLWQGQLQERVDASQQNSASEIARLTAEIAELRAHPSLVIQQSPAPEPSIPLPPQPEPEPSIEPTSPSADGPQVVEEEPEQPRKKKRRWI